MSTIETRYVTDEPIPQLVDEGIHRAQLARAALDAGDHQRAADDLSTAAVVLGVAANLLAGEPAA